MGYDFIVNGDIIREEARQDTPLGKNITELINDGELVPDDMAIYLLEKHIASQPDTHGLIIDGFPRTVPQAEYLDKDMPPTHVMVIDLPYDVALKRVAGRVVCPSGHTFNIYYVKSAVEGICDHDGLPLTKRADDSETAVRKRLDIYTNVTKPIIDYYKKTNRVSVVDGNRSVADVAKDIEVIVQAHAH